ncbi:MAG TPA: M48 family metalloprotease, partial [Alphaproteobacteria bacterium]|nr:M48 family metalloprotease [Alphaproteobacteria bacterium]
KAQLFLLVPAALFLLLPAADAQEGPGGSGMTVIRDVEIEKALHDFGNPIFLAAGLNPSSVHLVIVRDPIMNAYVAGGMNIFLHTALLQATDNVMQLTGVIAHETGHISGGHLARGSSAMKSASAQAILSMVLGVGAAIASGDPNAGAAVMTGGQQIAQRSMLGFTRVQEGSADAAGMRFLDESKLTSRGLLEFLQKLGAQETLPVDRQVEYARTHPLTQDRIDAVRAHVEQSPYADAPAPPQLQEEYARMKAKLLGYLQPDAALLRYADKDPRPTARYARAIAYYQKGDTDQAVALLDGLLKEAPNDPFYHELKGQILFEAGQVKQAEVSYRKAVTLLPKAGLLQAAYGHVLVELHDPALLDEAIQHLQRSVQTEPHEPSTWRFMATAWGEKKNEGMAAYCLAEEALAEAHNNDARRWAERAVKLLPKGSPYALRSQDIIKEARENEDDKNS